MSVLKNLIGRLCYSFIVLMGITLGTFALFELAPGDQAEVILLERYEAPGKEQIEALRNQLDLHSPWLSRYFSWLFQVSRGNWGKSRQSGKPVWEEIFTRLPSTLRLAVSSFILVVFLSLVSGGIAAFGHNGLPDKVSGVLTIIATAIPAYWLGLLLIYFFSVKIKLFPPCGYGEGKHLVLPSITLAFAVSMLHGRVLRATLIKIRAMNYIRFAVSKGLSPFQIFFTHMLRNALPPMLTIWGMALGQLLGGAVIVESVFAWPGIGKLTVEAVMTRDIPLVQAIVFGLAGVFVVINQLTEILHHRLNPSAGANLL